MNINKTANRNLTILLVEDDQDACEEIESYINTLDTVCLVGITNNSTDALNMVKKLLPDAVILDLELHHGGGNGLEFLHNLTQISLIKRPYILITTNNTSNITYETARNLGADFIMSKHESSYSGPYVIDFLQMIHTTLLSIPQRQTSPIVEAETPAEKNKNLLKRIYRELDFIGINHKYVGYQYLAEAILLTIENPEMNVIPSIAQKNHKSDISVEHAMRNAINTAWRTAPIEELEAHYTAKIHSSRGVPTIMEFLFYYARLLNTE